MDSLSHSLDVQLKIASSRLVTTNEMQNKKKINLCGINMNILS